MLLISLLLTKFDLVSFASGIQLSNVLFERFDKELLGFLAHDVYLTGDPLVHFLLSLGGVFSFKLLWDLTNFGFCFILWLIYFLFTILSRISKLVLNVKFSLLTLSELDEKVGEAWVTEESLLGFLGVFVHCVSYHLEIDWSSLNHFFDVFLLEVMRQNDGKDGWSELKNLSGVHWALKLFVGIGVWDSLADVEEVFAEVIGLLVEGLFSEVVLDIFEVAIWDWKLGGFVFKRQEEFFKWVFDFITNFLWLIRDLIDQLLRKLIRFDQYL